MPESPNRIDLGKLAFLAYKGQLFQVADSATGTALLGVNFVLWNSGTKGIPIRVIGIQIQGSVSTAGMLLGPLIADPGLALGNSPVNLRLGDASPAAYNEAAAAAPITPAGVIFTGIVNYNVGDMLAPASVYVPPNNGLVLSIPVGVATYSILWRWAELPPELE